MSTTTTLSRYIQKDGSPAIPEEETQHTDFTQIACCAVGAGDTPEHQVREKLLRDHTEGTGRIPFRKRFSELFK